jgi:hypothetical protein
MNTDFQRNLLEDESAKTDLLKMQELNVGLVVQAVYIQY